MDPERRDDTSSGIGTLFGVGVGPGDPELVTVKARRVIAACQVIVSFAARRKGGRGNGLAVVEALLDDHHEHLRLSYPVTTEPVEEAEYARRLTELYDGAAGAIAAELDRGHDTAVICEGDPFFYGSYMYLHRRLAGRYPVEVVPGVTSVAAAAAAAGTPLVSLGETLTVIPATLPPEELQEAMASSGSAVVMKVGRNLPVVREAALASGLAKDAVYVELASCTGQRVIPLLDTDDVTAPYFSVVLFPSRVAGQR